MTNSRLERQGYACLYERETEALDQLDSLVRSAVQSAVRTEVVEWRVTSMIDEEDLVKCGYISGFPTQLTIAATVNDEALGRVAETKEVESGDLKHRAKHFAPAACLNVYPMLGEQKPERDGVVTTLATVYRFEPSGFAGLRRLWEFNVREFVFVGSREFVQEMLETASTAAVRLARDAGLDASIAHASDHFYPSRENRVREKLQAKSAMKRELVAHGIAGAEKALALASFNFHDAHFSRPYAFDRNQTVVTGCVGFGLQRWLFASEDPNTKLLSLARSSQSKGIRK